MISSLVLGKCTRTATNDSRRNVHGQRRRYYYAFTPEAWRLPLRTTTTGTRMAQSLPGMKPRADQTLALNMKLLSHHELQGFGGIGEGMGMQLTRDGRRILWLAHESAPKNFTAVDVTDPKKPHVIVQTELPHAKVPSAL